MKIPYEELGSFDGALHLCFAMAQHWGLYEIPDGKQVMITGMVVEDFKIKETGVALMIDRDEGNWLNVSDCTFINTPLFDLVDILLSVVNDLVEAEATEPVTWRSRLRKRLRR